MPSTDMVVIVGTGSCSWGTPNGKPQTFVVNNQVRSRADAERGMKRIAASSTSLTYEIVAVKDLPRELLQAIAPQVPTLQDRKGRVLSVA